MTVNNSVVLTTPAQSSIVALRISGKLTKEDYEQFLPLLEQRIREHGKIRLLVELGDFEGWTASAAWEDIKFDFKHFTDIERIAIVGHGMWEHGLAVFSKPFTAAKVRFFDREDVEEARRWIQADRRQEEPR